MFTFATFWQYAKDLGANEKKMSIMRIRSSRRISDVIARTRPEEQFAYDCSGWRTGHYIGIISYASSEAPETAARRARQQGAAPLAASGSGGRTTLYFEIA